MNACCKPLLLSDCADRWSAESERIPAMAGKLPDLSGRTFPQPALPLDCSPLAPSNATPLQRCSAHASAKARSEIRLFLRVVALAGLCFAAAAAYVLFETDRSARARADWIAEVVAKDLALQQGQSHWIQGAPNQFPDLQRVAAAIMAPGYASPIARRMAKFFNACAAAPRPTIPARRSSSPICTSAFSMRAASRRPRELRQGGAR